MSDGEFRIGEKYTVIGDIAAGEVSDVFEVVEDAMKTAIPMKVPIVIEMGIGDTWLDAH